MEDVLDLYAKPCDHHQPVVCFDELAVQLVSEVRAPLTHASRARFLPFRPRQR